MAPDQDFEMTLGDRQRLPEDHARDRRRGKGRRQAHSRRPTLIAKAKPSPGICSRSCSRRRPSRRASHVERVAFNAVTKQAILAALAEPRQIDETAGRSLSGAPRPRLSRRLHAVARAVAQASRRKVRRPRAVGGPASRVRPRGRDRGLQHRRILVHRSHDGDRARAKSSRPACRRSPEPTLKKLDIKDEASAKAIKAAIEKGDFKVVSVEKKPVKRNPYAPFMTSTLQMDASRKLGFSAKQTMQVAQRLYEGVDIGGETVGLITYMRTDGVTIVPEAISAIRGLIAREYSQRYVAPFVREYKTKAKNAQEAHEAIRPTDVRAQALRSSRAISRRIRPGFTS